MLVERDTLAMAAPPELDAEIVSIIPFETDIFPLLITPFEKYKFKTVLFVCPLKLGVIGSSKKRCSVFLDL